MKSRAVRLTLFLLFVIALGATAYLFWLGETRLQVESTAARGYDARVHSIIRDFDRLRAFQLAYVAAGQGDHFWAARVASTLTELKGAIEALKGSSTAAGAAAATDQALAILEDFEQMDRRARDFARSGQRLLASDLIFSDGLELTTAGAEAIQRAGAAEREAQDEVAAGVRGRQLYAIGSAAAAALLVALLLVPTGKAEASPGIVSRPAEALDRRPSPAPHVAADVSLDEGWSRATVVKPDEGPVPEARPESVGPQDTAAKPALGAASAPAPSAPLTVELGSLAALCADLARVSDDGALPGLLARAAATLDASGIVLWIADPDGRELAPILTHGYPQNVVTRLGTIQRDAENATAAALRTALLQTVTADTFSEGAIAAPLVTPTGCVGVMAAEVRSDGERDPMKLAAATIVAAQLATLVGPPSNKARAEAAG